MDNKFISKILKTLRIHSLVSFLKKMLIPGFNGLSVYDVAEIYVYGIIKGAFSMRASAISYSLFSSIFPFLLFLINLIPFVPVNGFQQEFLNFIYSLLPPKTSDFFDAIIKDIVNKQRVGLLSSTFVLSMLFMTNGVNAVFNGFSNSFHTTINRSFIKQYIVALGVAVIVALFLFTVVYVNVYVTYLTITYTKYLIGDVMIWINLCRISIFIIMIYFTTAIVFYFGTKDGKSTPFFSIGALLTTILIICTTYGFAFYINNFSNYNELYGSIGALLILMFYVWINSNLVLLGYELNATLRRLRKIQLNQNK